MEDDSDKNQGLKGFNRDESKSHYSPPHAGPDPAPLQFTPLRHAPASGTEADTRCFLSCLLFSPPSPPSATPIAT